MKNIVFIPNIDLGNGRNNPYHYSIKSWQKWCKKHDVTLFEWKESKLDPSIFPITFQRYMVFDILEESQITYDKILMVDADTIVHPNMPNLFSEIGDEMGVTINNGSYEWVLRSIKNWGDSIFPNEPKIKTWKYFNGGFQIVNPKHKEFYRVVMEFYKTNIETINYFKKQIQAGTDQTIINYLTQIYGIKKKVLPECYNLQELHSKSLLHIPGYSHFKDELIFLDAGWVYHFNGIPQNPSNRDVSYWMERTYKYFYNE